MFFRIFWLISVTAAGNVDETSDPDPDSCKLLDSVSRQ